MKILENAHLDAFTTLRVGGPARYLAEVTSIDELGEIIHRARREALPVFVLGAGSNILISDQGFDGYVVRISIKGVDINNLGEGNYELIVGAGEQWDAIVDFVVNQQLWGIENLSLIPGTVGGSVVQNIGAYGKEIEEVINWVEVFDKEQGITRKLKRTECDFGYRDSIFKHQEGEDLIVTRVSMLLSKEGTPRTDYKDIKAILEKNNIKEPTLDQMRKIVVGIRSKKFPTGGKHGSAGSFFMNPVVSRFKYMMLRFRYPGIPGYKTSGGIKVSAAWIIDHVCNLKGVNVGNVGLYENQPLVLITNKNATSADVKRLSELVQHEVYSKTKIKLIPEVTFVGF